MQRKSETIFTKLRAWSTINSNSIRFILVRDESLLPIINQSMNNMQIPKINRAPNINIFPSVRQFTNINLLLNNTLVFNIKLFQNIGIIPNITQVRTTNQVCSIGIYPDTSLVPYNILLLSNKLTRDQIQSVISHQHSFSFANSDYNAQILSLESWPTGPTLKK